MNITHASAVVLLWPLAGLAGNNATSNPHFLFSAPTPIDVSPPPTDSQHVAVADVDGDGDSDVFLAEGTPSPAGRQNRLLINDGDGRFSEQSTTRLPPMMDNSAGADFIDIDNDGDMDLVVANLGDNRLLVNDGAGFFTDVTATQLPMQPANPFDNISAQARFVDVDNDGAADLVIANENPFDFAGGGGQNMLYLNDGNGIFRDATGNIPSRLDQTSDFAIGDINKDHYMDLIAINAGQNFVLINNQDGSFRDETSLRLPSQLSASRRGVLADVDRDKHIDLVVANSRDQQNQLFTNDGSGRFVEVTATTLPIALDTSTDVDLADIDRDGDLDLYLSNAGDFDRTTLTFSGASNRLYLNNGKGVFLDYTHIYFPTVADVSFNAALTDFNGDRRLDVFVANSGDPGTDLVYFQQRRAHCIVCSLKDSLNLDGLVPRWHEVIKR